MRLISVIVPVYNVEKYVEICIKSIINQSYRNLEIILIDDGSTDNSGKICDKLSKKDDRVIVKHQQNQGVSSARNLGLKLAHGDYISMVDADDILEENMYQEMMNNMIKYDSDVCICNFWYLNNESLKKNEINLSKTLMDNKDFLKNMCLLKGVGGYLWNKLYKKSMIENLRFYKEIVIMEDFLFNCEVANKARKISYIDTCLYYYRQWPNSALKKISLEKNISLLYGLDRIIPNLDKYQIKQSERYKLMYIFEAKKALTMLSYKGYTDMIGNIDYKKYLSAKIFISKSNLKWKLKVIFIIFFPKIYCKLKCDKLLDE